MGWVRNLQLDFASVWLFNNKHREVFGVHTAVRFGIALLSLPLRLLALTGELTPPSREICLQVPWSIVALGFAIWTGSARTAVAQVQGTTISGGPRILIVSAHPDDESCFSVMTYKITHSLGGIVDQLVITNGEGGYRYSLLAESYYNAKLTTESVGRAMLPQIRKQELFDSGKILGISNHYFLDQRDLRYTQDTDEVLHQHWNTPAIIDEVNHRLQDGHYDFVLTLFPSPDTHGGHKAAAWVSVEAVKQIAGKKPVVLACQDSVHSSTSPLDWTVSKSADNSFELRTGEYAVNRTAPFGFNNRLTYQIIANWVITSHKSAGAFQLDVNRYDQENFRILETNTADANRTADRLFNALGQSALPSSEQVTAQALK